MNQGSVLDSVLLVLTNKLTDSHLTVTLHTAPRFHMIKYHIYSIFENSLFHLIMYELQKYFRAYICQSLCVREETKGGR